MARPKHLIAAVSAISGFEPLRATWPLEALRRDGLLAKPGAGRFVPLNVADAAIYLVSILGVDHGAKLAEHTRAFALLETVRMAEPRPDDTIIGRLDACNTFVEAIAECLRSSVELLAMLATYAAAAHPTLTREAAGRLLFPPHEVAGISIEFVRQAFVPVGGQILIWRRGARREQVVEFAWTYALPIAEAEAAMRATQGTDVSDKKMLGLRGLLKVAGVVADREDDEAEAATSESTKQ